MANPCNITFLKCTARRKSNHMKAHIPHHSHIIIVSILGWFQFKGLDFTQKTSNVTVCHIALMVKDVHHKNGIQKPSANFYKNMHYSVYTCQAMFFFQIIIIKSICSPLNFFSIWHLYKVSQNNVNKLGKISRLRSQVHQQIISCWIEKTFI